MDRRRLQLVLLCAALLWALLVPKAGSAQVLYGSIVGNVRDASEAVVVGATVTITNLATKQSREATTNEMGGYSFPTLPPGTYGLKVSKEGFNTFTETAVSITPSTVTRLDVSLKVGAVTESVTVTGAAAALQTDRSEVRTEMGKGQLENLPTPVGRNYQNFFVALPGFTNLHFENSVPSNPSRALAFNVNGASQSINSTKIDGAQSINVWLPHEAAYVPTLESVETVNAVTNSFDAETGLAGGAAVFVQTKSGTNDLHGVVFEHHSNQHLKAKPYFIPAGFVKPKLVLNEFGGALGGPIKKEKLFYFASYEGTYDRENASQFNTVPTAAIRSGDMSGSNNPIYDPATGDSTGAGRTPFANKLVPASRQSAITRKLVALTPQPNVPGDLLTQNYYATGSYIFDRHRLDTKVNFNAGKLTTYARLGFLHYDMINPESLGEVGGNPLSSAGGNPGHGWGNTYTVTVAGTYLLTSRLIVDAYWGWTSLRTNVETPGLDQPKGLNLGIPGTNGPKHYMGGWPNFTVDNYTQLGIDGAYLPYYRRDPSRQYVANFNWAKGAHDVRFGLELSRQHMNQIQAEGGVGAGMGGFTFSGGPTTLRGGPSSNQYNSYASFLLGLPNQFGKNTIVPDSDTLTTRAWQYSSYIRDRWNVTPRLTISVGARWEHFPLITRAPGDPGLGLYLFDTNQVKVCGYGSVPKDCGVHIGKFRILPRIGIAYRATSTFVIRMGYGITNDPFSLARSFRTAYPEMVSVTYTGLNSYQPAGRIENGIPPVIYPDMKDGIIDVPNTYSVSSINPDFKRGYIQSWNFTLQKQIPLGFTAQAGYVATRATAAMGSLNLNAGQVPGLGAAGQPLYQKFGRTTGAGMITSLSTNMYDSLQANLDRRFSQGLQLGVNWTWSKTIGWTENSGGYSIPALNYLRLNRGVRGFDRAHSVAITGTWELPFGHGKRWISSSRAGSAILGGWRINSLASVMTGRPFTASASSSSLNMPSSSQRADQVKPTVEILGGVGRGRSYFDPFAFKAVTEARFGNAGFNSIRGPGLFDWQFGLFREFALKERFRLQFRAEGFNFTNTPHFSNPGSNVSNMILNPDGTIRSLSGYTEITSLVQVGRDCDERYFRFGLRLSF